MKGQVTKSMNNGYEAFMSHGHVLVKENIEYHVVDILRDTGPPNHYCLRVWFPPWVNLAKPVF